MILFPVPDEDVAVGGNKQIYRHVSILNEHGICARVLHARPGFRCTWFENDAPIAYLGEPPVARAKKHALRLLRRPKEFDLALDRGRQVLVPVNGELRPYRLTDGDGLALAEFHGLGLTGIVTQLPLCIFNQNAHGTFHDYPFRERAPSVYHQRNLRGTVVVSEHSRQYVSFAFPDLRVERVINGVDHKVFYPPSRPKKRQLAYMPRKLPQHLQQVLNLLRYRDALRDWELVEIQGLPENQVAERLRDAAIFLSSGTQEGFGLPPVEAGMCGCLVVGYSGYGGEEYMLPELAEPVRQNDALGFARRVEESMRWFESSPEEVKAKTDKFSAFLAERYSLEKERESVLAAWSGLLGDCGQEPKA